MQKNQQITLIMFSVSSVSDNENVPGLTTGFSAMDLGIFLVKFSDLKRSFKASSEIPSFELFV